MLEMHLIKRPDETIALCHLTQIGLLPAVIFKDIDELERFALGLVGYCHYQKPSIPEPFIKAFSEEDKDARSKSP